MADKKKPAPKPAGAQDGSVVSSQLGSSAIQPSAAQTGGVPPLLYQAAASQSLTPELQAELLKAMIAVEMEKAAAEVRSKDAETRKKDAETEGLHADAQKKEAEAEEARAETRRKDAAASVALASPEHKTGMELEARKTSAWDRRLMIIAVILSALGMASLAMSAMTDGLASSYPWLHALTPTLRVYGTGAAAGGLGIAVTRFVWKQISIRLTQWK